MSSDFGAFGPGRVISDRVLTRGLYSTMPVENVGKHQRIVLGEVTDQGTIDQSTSLASTKGRIPLYTVGATVINGTRYLDLHVCGHAVSEVGVFGANTANSRRIPVPDADYGSVVLAPGKAGWPFAKKYFDLTDSVTGKVHRVTRVFVQESSVYATSHQNNQIGLCANVCGMTQDAEGEEGVVVDYFQAMQMIIDNWVLRSPGYYTGDYLGAPQWEDGTYQTHSQSFKTTQRWSRTKIGGRGYIVSGVINDAILNREVLKRFHVTAHCETGWTKRGQFFVTVPFDTMDYSNTKILREPQHLRLGVVPQFDVSQVENPVIYSSDYDYDLGRWVNEAQKIWDQVAIDRVGREMPSPSPIECWMSGHAATVRDAMSRRLLWRRYPPRPVELVMPEEGIDLELAQVVRINSDDGPGPAGYVNSPVRLIDCAYDRFSRRVTWKGWDISHVVQIPLVMQEDGDSTVLMQDDGNFQYTMR